MKKTTANELTKQIVEYLNLNGYKAWRNNNMGVWDEEKQTYRRNPLQALGIPDVLAYDKETGAFLTVEVKIGRDQLSQNQRQFNDDLNNTAMGNALVAKNMAEFILQFNSRD